MSDQQPTKTCMGYLTDRHLPGSGELTWECSCNGHWASCERRDQDKLNEAAFASKILQEKIDLAIAAVPGIGYREGTRLEKIIRVRDSIVNSPYTVLNSGNKPTELAQILLDIVDLLESK